MSAPEATKAELVVLPQQELAPLAALSEEQFRHRLEQAKLNVTRMSQIQREVMDEGSDYGVIPGTTKPTLLQPGAQLLNKMGNLTPAFDVERTCGDGETSPHIDYRVKCQLTGPDGAVWEGVGSCNSWEPRYRWRQGERKCPACGSDAIRQARADDPEQAFYCWRKVGGCGASWSRETEEAEAIASQSVDRQENPDPWGLDNTLLKIAAKRALVHATTLAHACSRIFTQDIEDSAGPGDQKPAANKKRKPSQAEAEKALGSQKGATPNKPLGGEAIDQIETACRRRLEELGLDEQRWADVAKDVVRQLGYKSAAETPETEFARFVAAVIQWDDGASDFNHDPGPDEPEMTPAQREAVGP